MKKSLLLAFLLFIPASFASADLKIATVDLGKAFQAFYKTKESNAKLKEKEDSYRKDLSDMQADYDHMVEEANKLKDAASDPTLSPSAQDEKKKALTAKIQDVQNMNRKLQETNSERSRELQDEEFRRRKEIVDEISKVVTDYSGPQGYDLVLDKSPSAATGVPVVLFNSPKLVDITGEIITKLNSTAPPAGASSPAPSGAGTPLPASP
jgi:Skp family chaperone for outer membrane proteins